MKNDLAWLYHAAPSKKGSQNHNMPFDDGN